MAAEIENHWHNTVNPETVQRVLRNNDFHGRMARKKSFVSQKNQREWNLQKSMEFWKTFLFSDESKYNIFSSDGCNCVWWIQGEEFWKKKKCLSNFQAWCWECDGMRIHGRVRSGKSSFYQKHHDQHIYVNVLWELIKATAENLGLKKILLFTMAMTQKVSSHLVRGWCLYNSPKVIKTLPQSPDLNMFENLWAKLGIEVRNHLF